MSTVNAIGLEHLALDAGEREDRQVDDHDDQRAEHASARRTSRDACEDHVEALRRASAGGRARCCAGGEAAHAVLDHDDGAVDDDAEVDRAEAHQVAADAAFAPCR